MNANGALLGPSAVRAFTCLIRPFFDRLDVTIPWLFYPAPPEAIDGPTTWITPRWWDEREHWESVGVGMVYGSAKPYFGPVPHRPQGPIVGTPSMWRDGLSYAVWQAGGYSDPVGCWDAPRGLTPIKLNQRQSLKWAYLLRQGNSQVQSLVMQGAPGLPVRQVQGLRMYPAMGGGHQLQSLRLEPRVSLAVAQVQGLGMSPIGVAQFHQLQSLALAGGAEQALGVNQLQALALAGGAELALGVNQLQALALAGGAELALGVNQLQALALAPIGAAGMHQLQALGLVGGAEQALGVNQLQALGLVGGPRQPLSMNQLQSLTMKSVTSAKMGQVQSLTLTHGTPSSYMGAVGMGSTNLNLFSTPSPPIPNGYQISGPGVPSGTTVISTSGTSVTMSAAATTTTFGTYTFSP